RSHSFLYLQNLDHLTSMEVWSRFVNWLIGLLIGYLLFRLTQNAPPAENIAAMLLWAFQPTLLAFGGTAKLDIPTAFWFLLCLMVFNHAQNRNKTFLFAVSGFLAGLCAAARYYGIFVLPIILILEIVDWFKTEPRQRNIKDRLVKEMTGIAGFASAIFLCYLPGMWTDPSHSWPFHFYINHMMDYKNHIPEIMRGFPTFDGKIWPYSSYLFFPEQFILKNTTSFVVLLTMGFFLILTHKLKVPCWIWLSPLVYIGLFWLVSDAGNGGMNIRHTIPAIPFLILVAAKTFLWFFNALRNSNSKLIKNLPLLVLLWGPFSVICNYPHFFAYTNDFITIRQKPDLLSSFNWSLGQDIKRLAETGRERGWKRVKFISSGRTDPYYYGLDWQPWSLLDLSSPQPGTVYVIDPCLLKQNSNYYSMFFRKGSWLESTAPTGNIGGTFYYYEFTGTSVPDNSPVINSFPFYHHGQPYHPQPNTAFLEVI
ncbi:MAG TPA: hypothetical protein VN963_04645, partial [bacterium]|nr:hypothetical protein [bacterium]